MADYFGIIASELGIAVWFLVVILIWEGVWKLIALWKAARNKHLVWFIVLALVNSVGILPILYIYVFSKLPKGTKATKNKKRKR